MYLLLSRTAPVFLQVLMIAAMTFQGYAAEPVRFQRVGPVVAKEPNMPPADPKNPQKESPPIPEMVGATSAPFYIGPGPVEISFEIHPPTGPALLRSNPRVELRVENITSEVAAPPFTVYLELPAGETTEEHPELHAGNLGFFGLEQNSSEEGAHGGQGLSIRLNVTGVFARLALRKDWDRRHLRVLFVPGPWDAAVPRVKVGRVSLHFI
jgi:hypothetical protein